MIVKLEGDLLNLKAVSTVMRMALERIMRHSQTTDPVTYGIATKALDDCYAK